MIRHFARTNDLFDFPNIHLQCQEKLNAIFNEKEKNCDNPSGICLYNYTDSFFVNFHRTIYVYAHYD